ncbi:MAG: DUF411 domain-containing protein [Magnetospirillum sp.]|nr:DUF411 domain-containing protein [Magnetospirillum sp.]
MITRRTLVLASLALPVLQSGSARAAEPLVEVWKSKSCGCCQGWIDHMRQHGYRVKVTDLDDVDPIKNQLAVPEALRSCHTARVDGYVIEGHVPAQAVDRLLKERPKVTGLSSPDMPAGSPGMEGAGPKEVNDVRSWAANGRQAVFGRY